MSSPRDREILKKYLDIKTWSDIREKREGEERLSPRDIRIKCNRCAFFQNQEETCQRKYTDANLCGGPYKENMTQ